MEVNNENDTCKKLSDLPTTDRVLIARKICSNSPWRFIGITFQPEIKYDQLRARSEERTDEALCIMLIEELSNLHKSILELASALKHEVVGLDSIADEVVTKYCPPLDRERWFLLCNKEKRPDKAGNVESENPKQFDATSNSEDKTKVKGRLNEVVRHKATKIPKDTYVLAPELPLDLEIQAQDDTIQSIDAAIMNNAVVVVKDLKAVRAVIWDYFNKCQEYMYKVWINASSEQEVLRSISSIAVNAKVPKCGASTIEELNDDVAFPSLVEMFKRFNALIVFDNCRLEVPQITALYEALQPSPTTQHPIIITTSKELNGLQFKIEVIDIMTLSDDESLFLELLKFVEQTPVPVPVPVPVPLSLFQTWSRDINSILRQLLATELVHLDESQKSVTADQKALEYAMSKRAHTDKQLFVEWTNILRSSGDLHFDWTDVEKRASIFKHISSHCMALFKQHKKETEEYLSILVQFIFSHGYVSEDDFNAKAISRDFMEYHALLQLGGSTRWQSSSKDKGSLIILNNSKLPPRLRLIHKYCQAVNWFSQKKVISSADVSELDNTEQFSHTHPFYLRIQLLIALNALRRLKPDNKHTKLAKPLKTGLEDKSSIIQRLQRIYDTREKENLECDVLLAEAAYYLGKLKVGEQAKSLFLKSLKIQLRLDERVNIFKLNILSKTAAKLLASCQGEDFLYSEPTDCTSLSTIKQKIGQAMSKRQPRTFPNSRKSKYTCSSYSDRSIFFHVELNHKNSKIVVVWKKKNKFAVGFTKL